MLTSPFGKMTVTMKQQFAKLVLLFLFFISPTATLWAQGQMVINEVLYDPVGANTGTQLVELKNIGNAPVNIGGWWFCARQDYSQIDAVAPAGPIVPPDSFLVAHIGANGTNTQRDVYLPFMVTLQSVSDLNLYLTGNFGDPTQMVDFVQWGGVPPVGRENEAVQASQWVAGQFVPSVPGEGISINYDGTGDSANDWYWTAPSIGSENLPPPLSVPHPSGGISTGYMLAQNYPNPFNPSTTIQYELPQEALIMLKIYNLLGEEVTTLVSEDQEAGSYNVQLDGTGLASGVYFYRLKAGEFVETRKFVLLR